MEIYNKSEYVYNLTDEMKKKTISIKIELPVSFQTLEDILVTALEGGINYWGGVDKTLVEWKDKPKDMPVSQYAFQILVNGNTIKFFDIEDEDDSVWILTLDKLIKGIQLNYINRPFDSDLDNMDADTADCIIQYALFGDIVFG